MSHKIKKNDFKKMRSCLSRFKYNTFLSENKTSFYIQNKTLF